MMKKSHLTKFYVMVLTIIVQQQSFEQCIKTSKANQSYKDTYPLRRHKSKLPHFKVMHDLVTYQRSAVSKKSLCLEERL